MTAILLNDTEWGLFAGEPAELLKLYVALKRRMDFATGIAGQYTLINEIVLREGFTVDPIRGRPKTKPYSREQGRSAIRRMEKIGVIKVIGPLIFEFPHAKSDQSVRNNNNQTATKQQPDQQPVHDTPETRKDGASSTLSRATATCAFFDRLPNSNLLPVSGNTYTAHNARATFAMTASWEPDPTTFTGVLFRNGMAGQRFHPDQLLEFRSYWISNPDRHRTQAQWEHALAQQMKRQLRTQQATEENPNETRGRTHQRRARNAHDILTDPNW